MKQIFGEGLIIIFKMIRSPHGAASQGDLVIAKRNPEALWISGYEDRIIYDGRKADAKYEGLGGLLAQLLVPELIAAKLPS